MYDYYDIESLLMREHGTRRTEPIDDADISDEEIEVIEEVIEGIYLSILSAFGFYMSYVIFSTTLYMIHPFV